MFDILEAIFEPIFSELFGGCLLRVVTFLWWLSGYVCLGVGIYLLIAGKTLAGFFMVWYGVPAGIISTYILYRFILNKRVERIIKNAKTVRAVITAIHMDESVTYKKCCPTTIDCEYEDEAGVVTRYKSEVFYTNETIMQNSRFVNVYLDPAFPSGYQVEVGRLRVVPSPARTRFEASAVICLMGLMALALLIFLFFSRIIDLHPVPHLLLTGVSVIVAVVSGGFAIKYLRQLSR